MDIFLGLPLQKKSFLALLGKTFSGKALGIEKINSTSLGDVRVILWNHPRCLGRIGKSQDSEYSDDFSHAHFDVFHILPGICTHVYIWPCLVCIGFEK